jgi:ketosteroid isomerase-like protein
LASREIRRVASRARRRVRGANPVPDSDLTAGHEVVDAFLAAARNGDFDALVALLDPDVVLRADQGVLAPGSRIVRGVETVARQALMYSRLDLRVHHAIVNGAAGAVSTRDGRPFAVSGFTIRAGRIVAMDILADPDRLAQLDLAVLDE